MPGIQISTSRGTGLLVLIHEVPKTANRLASEIFGNTLMYPNGASNFPVPITRSAQTANRLASEIFVNTLLYPASISNCPGP